jgi:hypothetical protein
MTRQILPYNNDTEFIMFILTVTIGYGIGSFMLLRYTGGISKEIRNKSHIINSIHWSVTIIQFFLLARLLNLLLYTKPQRNIMGENTS